jgi:hypothetical protein
MVAAFTLKLRNDVTIHDLSINQSIRWCLGGLKCFWVEAVILIGAGGCVSLPFSAFRDLFPS